MSMRKAQLEARSAALEVQVARLEKEMAAEGSNGLPWWRRIAGTIPDDEMERRAEAYGRQYRESLRPKPKKRKKNVGTRHRSRQPAATRK